MEERKKPHEEENHGFPFPPGNRKLLIEILNIGKQLICGQGVMMGLVEDIQKQQADTKVSLQAVAEDTANLVKQIADLIAAGGAATKEQLESILADATSIANTVKSLDDSVPAPVVPLPPVTPDVP